MQPPPLIAVRRLSVPPGQAGESILSGVSFSISAGERVALSGPSGSGKSTLLRAMVLLEPAGGEIMLDGAEVGPGRVRELRRRVGYVPQKPVPVADTIAGNLSFPATIGHGDAGGDELQPGLLARLGLAGLDRGRRFDSLSGGEQQRIALVRSLSAEPDVLLMDEPTASLDPENVDDVVALLRDWSVEGADRALVWVSHHAHHVRDIATRRVTMAELSI